MLKIQFIAISLFINLVTGACQNKAAEPVKGTRLILELPKEFKEDSSIPGFISEIDSSIIFISEIENPYSFEELIQKRISNSLALGVDTSDFRKFMYDGYMAVQFNTYIPVTNQNGFTVNFGSDKFLIDISIEASKEKIKELKNVVLSGKYDKSLEINSDFLLGFTASFEGTNLSLFKKDAHTINTKEKDKLGNVVSWLNLTRMPKSSYEGLNASEAIDVTYSLYNFNKNYTHTDSLEIDNSKLLWKVYTQDRVTFTEYNIIGVIQKKEFDLLIMGGVNNKEKLSKIYGVLKSIKFNSTG